MNDVDILIIGAGAVGLAIAKELSHTHNQVAVVEKQKSFGQETSSRNSEVIHGGMYYPTGTLKARLCVEGRRLLYDTCRDHKIRFKKTGKLIVANDADEIQALEKLFLQGRDNGVENLRMVDGDELKAIEPHVHGLAALYSPETGIIDTHRLMEFYLEEAKDRGALVAFDSEVVAIDPSAEGYDVSVKNQKDVSTIKTACLINCAGLDSDTIAQMAGIDVDQSEYRLSYCKGQYFRVGGRSLGFLKGLVYPVPKPQSGGLGIHATPDLAGGVRLGPDDVYLKGREKDYSVDGSRKHDFYVSAKKFLPFLNEEELAPDTAGIRPKLQGPGDAFRDFIIQEESDKGLGGFINLIGIESPGLTASCAIGKYVRTLLDRI